MPKILVNYFFVVNVDYVSVKNANTHAWCGNTTLHTVKIFPNYQWNLIRKQYRRMGEKNCTLHPFRLFIRCDDCCYFCWCHIFFILFSAAAAVIVTPHTGSWCAISARQTNKRKGAKVKYNNKKCLNK